MKRQTRNLSHLALCKMKRDIQDLSIILLVSKGKAGGLFGKILILVGAAPVGDMHSSFPC